MHMPGSTSISRLKVYDTVTPDGQRGGTPHVHLLCSEMYFVLAGTGAVELIDAGGFACVELRPFDSLTFSPGTIHRLINSSGALELLVVMGHSGLPERGDNVVCFDEEWLTSDDAFAEAMRVQSLDEAYRRRDRGVEGFTRLKAAFAADAETGRAALRHFYELAIARSAVRRPEWAWVLERETADAREATERLASLDAGDISALLAAQHALVAGGDPASLGFCGHLHRYAPEGLLTP
jgi:mannose-6-phosphate isomerase-like protein (cupin superfamily)